MNYSEVINNRIETLNRKNQLASLSASIESINRAAEESLLGIHFNIVPKANILRVEWDRKNTKGEWEAEENSEAGSYYVQEFEFEEWQELETFFAQIVSTCCHVAIK